MLQRRFEWVVVRADDLAGKTSALALAVIGAIGFGTVACSPAKGPGGESPGSSGGSASAEQIDRTMRTERTRRRPLPVSAVCEYLPSMQANAGQSVTVGMFQSAKFLLGMTTPMVNAQGTGRQTVWNGVLESGAVRLGADDLVGSVEFTSGTGELYVDADHHEVAHAFEDVRQTSPFAFPIVVTTSGGVRAGSVGTAWYCLKTDNIHEFVLLENPDGDDGSLYVVFDTCWNDEDCVPTTVIRTPNEYIRVTTFQNGTATIEGPFPLANGTTTLRGKVEEILLRADDLGLRTLRPSPG